MTTVPLYTLVPNVSRFRLPDCGRTGTLESLSEFGAAVRYDGTDKQVTVRGRTFTARGKRTTISAATEVEVLT